MRATSIKSSITRLSLSDVDVSPLFRHDPRIIYPCSFATVEGASAIKSARIDENRSISPIRTTFAFADKRYIRRPAIRAMKRRYDAMAGS